MIMLSPNHFPLDHLLLELGQKVRSSAVGRGRISDAETGRGQEGDGVGQQRSRGF